MDNDLRKRVADILSTEHRVSATRLRSLSDKDTSELQAIASGELAPHYRVKALNLLTAAGDPRTSDVLRRALQDTGADMEVRAAAATLLSRLGGMAAEGALLERLPDETQPIVQHKILSGLARVGSEASLRRLADMVQAADPVVRDHARFAQSMIAYRAGIPGFELPVIDSTLRMPAPAGADTSAQMSATAPEDAHRVIEQTAVDSYGVAANPASVNIIQCGRRTLAVVMSAAPSGVSSGALAHPAIAGYVAIRAEVDGSYSTGSVIMCWPNGYNGLHISVNRTSGPAEYFGEGTVDDGAVRFRLDAVRRPGAIQATVTGKFAAAHITELSVATARSDQRVRLTPVEDR